MADCIYCGKAAGWFRKSHPECKTKADSKLESSPYPMGTETREITYREELSIAKARKRLWIRYQDGGGGESSRKIEIYNAQEDDYIFAWCCLKQEPRTFRKDRIKAWKILDEQFEYNPLVELWWREEGSLGKDRLPWNRWIEIQDPDPETALKALQEDDELNSPLPELSPAEKEAHMTGWHLMEKAIEALPDIKSKNLLDYTEAIRLYLLSIERGLTIHSKATVHRRVGEIYLECGDKKKAISHFESALRWNPQIGVKKKLKELSEEEIIK